MSHEIDMTNDRPNVAFIGDTPWHGLGERMLPDQTLDQWRIAAGMDWTIETAPVRFTPVTMGVDEVGGVRTTTHPEQQFPDKVVLYRSDTQTPLSIMSATRYHIVQPAQIIEFYRDLINESRFTMETAGCLFGGKKVWALARSNVEIKLGGIDILKPYLLLSSSCDGKMSTVADLTSVRVVCNNTLSMAVGSSGESASIRIPHNTKVNFDAIKSQLGLLDDDMEQFAERADQLTQIKAGKVEAVNYFADLYKKEDKDGTLLNGPSLEKTVNKLMELWLNGPGAQLKTSRGTAWGLVNAVTHFQDFDSRSSSNEHRFNRNQMGKGKIVKSQAFDKALALVA